VSIAPLPVGTLLQRGRYTLKSVIAHSGFSITYRAFDERTFTDVAIKEHAYAGACYRDTATGRVIAHRGQEILHARLTERLIREANLLVGVRHPHVVRVEAAWEEFGTAYYAMELLEGETLERWVEAAPSAEPSAERFSEVRRVALEILSALRAAHERAVYHCDLKPENVLLTERGAVLIDFGAARTGEHITRTVTLMPFTRGYAAPELLYPELIRDVGPWTDAYAWGMLVYGLVVGHRPAGIPLDAMERIARRMLSDVAPPDPYDSAAATLEAGGVPSAWAAGIAACLRIQRRERPGSMEALEVLLGEREAPEGEAEAREAPNEPSQPAILPPVVPISEREAPALSERTELSFAPSHVSFSPSLPSVVVPEISAPQLTPPPPSCAAPPSQPLPLGRLAAVVLGLLSIGAVNLVVFGPRSTASERPPDEDPPPVVTLAPENQPPVEVTVTSQDPACTDLQYECNGGCKRRDDPSFGCGRCRPSCKLAHVDKYACRGSRCAPKACEAGWDDCNEKPEDGCEIDLGTTLEHCGACGQRCAPGPRVSEAACVAGACDVVRCELGWDDCNDKPEDGCEVDLGTTLEHCGACGRRCEPGPKVAEALCVANACSIGRCNERQADCNGRVEDGCEVDLGQDVLHCGQCNAGCGGKSHVSAIHCQDGACAIDTCEAGWLNADADAANGCEHEIPPLPPLPPLPPPPSELPELPPPQPETLPPADAGG
jgi:serine/threonine protein kinase